LPAHCLAEEIDTPGEGKLRALITIAGNPVLSAPDSRRLDAALEGLDAMVAVDCYLNETTRHADVILPGPSPLEKSHYDVYLMQSALRSVANYSPAVLDLGPGMISEWQLMCRLAAAVDKAGPVDVRTMDDATMASMARASARDEYSKVAGRDPGELVRMLEPREGPERMLDFLLRIGPFGDAFGANPGGLTLDRLKDHPHGMDFGPLAPRLPDALRTPDGMIDLSPALLLAEARQLLTEPANSGMLLIGRRQLRSNNSWMHNLPHLVSGRDRCVLLIHPDDAAEVFLGTGDEAEVFNDTGSVKVSVVLTDDIRRGVISLPHGWGHHAAGTRLTVARRRAGVNVNELSPASLHDPLTGTAVLNGIPVSIRRVSPVVRQSENDR
jgi:anaerobic selenocysteine-containing dehydrogenase